MTETTTTHARPTHTNTPTHTHPQRQRLAHSRTRIQGNEFRCVCCVCWALRATVGSRRLLRRHVSSYGVHHAAQALEAAALTQVDESFRHRPAAAPAAEAADGEKDDGGIEAKGDSGDEGSEEDEVRLTLFRYCMLSF